jgi:hypothetical protein
VEFITLNDEADLLKITHKTAGVLETIQQVERDSFSPTMTISKKSRDAVMK